MAFVQVENNDGVATVRIGRGKVNAINGALVAELGTRLAALEKDPAVRAVILTGTGKFFSFGFDVPEFLPFTKEQFTEFLTGFTDLYTDLFLYSKPVIGALNGHTIAGGCMLSLACDYRIMAGPKARISLNEVTFGAAVLAGSVEMLRFSTGSANAAQILYSGAMYNAEEARRLSLIHEVADENGLFAAAEKIAKAFAAKPPEAFSEIKSLLRKPVAEAMKAQEAGSIQRFVDIWYSETTWANLKNIQIR